MKKLLRKKWNQLKSGISIIEQCELLKLVDIISSWKQLFEFAPEEYCITGDFLLDKNQYEKINLKKKVILEKMDLWRNLCRKAVVENAKILF